MSTPLKPPPRLVDDPSTSSLVRADLENVAGVAPGYDAAAGLAALKASLGGGAKVAAGASAAHVAKGALGLKLALAGGAAAIVIAGAAVFMRPAPAARTPPPSLPAPAPALPEAPAVPAVPALPLDVAPSARAPVAAPRTAAAAEIAQLAQIKAAVERSPARALRLAEQGHRRFGEGYLHHEREGLAIVALHALGRRDEAHARATRFLARYPHSSLSDRVRALEAAEVAR